jgi:hypothetical protein
LDSDIFPGSPTDPLTHWTSVADRVYLQAKPLSLQLTDPDRLAVDRFRGGGNLTHWPYLGGWLEYRRPETPNKLEKRLCFATFSKI